MYATGGVWCQLGTTKVSLSLRETLNGSPSSKKPVKQSSDPEGVKNVLKKVGSTSTSFIGPACRPGKTASHPAKTASHPAKTASHPAKTASHPAKTASHPAKTATRPDKTKPKGKNIEDSLNDFYQELESLDSPDAAPRPPNQQAPNQQAPNQDRRTRREPPNTNQKRSYDSFQYSGNGPNRQSQQQHWQPDGPFNHDPKRQRPSEDDYWRPHHPQMMGFPRPPRRFQPPHPHFSGPFPGPPPGHFLPHWNPYPHPQDSHFPPDHFLPPGMCRDPQPPGCRPSPPSHPGDDRWGGCGGEPAWPQISPAETNLVNSQEDCATKDPDSSASSTSSLSLILMRGLPGSGKSTFAR